LIFVAAGVEYEDFRLNGSDWPSIKKTTPAGHVPVLEVHENSKIFTIFQSLAISKFILYIYRKNKALCLIIYF
jgi:glutathione S-transferase